MKTTKEIIDSFFDAMGADYTADVLRNIIERYITSIVSDENWDKAAGAHEMSQTTYCIMLLASFLYELEASTKKNRQ